MKTKEPKPMDLNKLLSEDESSQYLEIDENQNILRTQTCIKEESIIKIVSSKKQLDFSNLDNDLNTSDEQISFEDTTQSLEKCTRPLTLKLTIAKYIETTHEIQSTEQYIEITDSSSEAVEKTNVQINHECKASEENSSIKINNECKASEEEANAKINEECPKSEEKTSVEMNLELKESEENIKIAEACAEFEDPCLVPEDEVFLASEHHKEAELVLGECQSSILPNIQLLR